MPYRLTIDFETDSETPPQIDFPGMEWDAEAEQPTGTDRPARVLIDGAILGVELVELEYAE